MSLFRGPFGLAYPNPISGLVASALESALLSKGFEQIQGMVIGTNPFIGDSLGIEGEEFGCQVFNGDPGQDTEVFLLGGFVSSDEGISGLNRPCGRSPS